MEKKTAFFLLILMSIFLISNVSAVEDSDLIAAESDIDTQIIEQNDDLQVDDDLLSDVNPDYREIQNQIDSADEGATINLTGGEYTCDYLININKTITIDGNGSTIKYDGDNEFITPFFYVNRTASNVVIKNIKFIGGTSVFSGAIHWDGNNGIISNCTFTDCSARDDDVGIGGAILIFGDNCTVTDSTFKGNNARLNGGAILCNGTGGFIRNCEFIGNSADGENNDDGYYGFGGALVLWGNNYTVINSTFRNNRCTNYGGAIACLKDNNKIVECKFYDNVVLNEVSDVYAPQGGGAIYSACDYLLVDNCTFIGNNASASNGGAISLSDNDTVKDSFFKGNHANLGNDLMYGSSIIHNYFVLDYGEKELDAIKIMGVTVDDLLRLNNTFEKTKIDSSISFSAGMIFTYGASGSIHVSVEGGKLEAKNIKVLNHPEAVISFSNDVLTVSNLAVGSYTLRVTTTPDEFHNPVNGDLSITVNKANAVIKASKVTVAYKKSSLWTMTIVDSRNNKPISNFKLTLKVYTGKKYKTVTVYTNAKGVASYQTKGLSAATHKIVVSAVDNSYNFNTFTSSIKVVKQTALKFKVKKKTIKTGASLSITVMNKKTKKALNGVKIKLLIYTGSKLTKTVVLKSMKKGKYKGVCGYGTNKLTVGTHKVKIVPYDIKYSGSASSKMKISKKAKKVPAWETKDSK